jgi:hypothetical protein
MTAAALGEEIEGTIGHAESLAARGQVHEAIELLTRANRQARSAELERALVRIRHEGCALLPPPVAVVREPILPQPSTGDVVEIGAGELSLAAVRDGFARSGCVLVRGLVPPERVEAWVAGVDATFAAYDASVDELGAPVDPTYYTPFPMPDLVSPEGAGDSVTIAPGSPSVRHIPVKAHRRFSRQAGGVWMPDSPRMLFEFFELVDDARIGALISAFLGERPFLSANKCNVRRIPPEEMDGGWHQDGAFLGETVASFNFWVALTRCGRDAPGLDILPKRLDRILTPGGENAYFKWSLSDADVAAASGGLPVVRPEFEAGDALLFDHWLVHRTGTSAAMTSPRHAIESWFFGPSAWPLSQLPLVY